MAGLGTLAEILNLSERIGVVDVGVRATVKPPPYSSLLARGAADVVGFDPDQAAIQQLNGKKGPCETYLPYAIGDGTERVLYICAYEEMTSLLEPNVSVLNLFSGFPKWGAVERTETISTTRLDDVPEIQAMDYLKMDVQGAELMVLQHGPRCLSSCLFVQTEVMFLSMYREQPLFSDIESFLRAAGFSLHKLWEPHHRALAPAMVNGDIRTDYGQLFWSDAIFVRDLTRLDRLSDAQLKKTAIVAYDLYQAVDLSLHVLAALDRRSGSRYADHLLEALST